MSLIEKKEKLNLKSDKTIISNVASLDIENPIPFEPSGTSDAFLYNRNGKGYIPFLATKDNFFQLLLEAKILSPTNLSCINSKSFFCTGTGLYAKDEKDTNDFIKWSKKVNKKGQSLNKILKLVFDNYFTCGNSFIEIVRGKIGSQKFVRIFNKSFLDCRLSIPDNDDFSESVFISKEFRKRNAWLLNRNKAVELPIYFGDDKMKWYKDAAQGTEHCIIHLKNEMSGYEYYGMPSNVSSLGWQILEYKGMRYNMDNFENNMVVGGVVVLQGNVTQEEAQKMGKEIVYQHTGDGKRGRYVILASRQGISDSKIMPFETKADGDYLKLDENTEKKIIDSNNWDSALYGNLESSGMGNGGFAYLSAIFDIKNKTVVEPARQTIIEDVLNPLWEICDDWMGTKWSDLEFDFRSVMPTSFIGDLAINKFITKDEGREILGLEKLDEATGRSFIDEGKQLNLFSDVQNK